MALRPGTQTLGRFTDPLGRTGLGIVVPYGYDNDAAQLLVVDPRTSQLLDQGQINGRGGTPTAVRKAGWVYEFAVVAALVDEVGRRG